MTETCDSLEVSRDNRQHSLNVGQDAVTDSDPVHVTLTISGPDGRVVFDGEVTARPQKDQPNGPGCEPTVWSTQVHASGVNDLRDIERPA